MTAADDAVGLRVLIGFILHRDRWRIATWLIGSTALMIFSGLSLRSLYDTPEKIQQYAQVAGGNPALVVFAGPGNGFDDPNLGVVLVNETLLWGALVAAFMSLMMVARHTRAEEESERTDLLRSSVVGRHASLAAALCVVTAMNLTVATLSFAGLAAQGYELNGSLALVGAIAACGLMFAGCGAVAAQVASSYRGAMGLGVAILGIAFAIRAIGDVGHQAISWLSPLGWTLAISAFAGVRWWTLLLGVFAAALLCGLAFVTSTRRDLGSGTLRPRPGPAFASSRLRGPTALAIRLQRWVITSWFIGLLITGIIFGAVGKDVAAMFEGNPDMAKYLAQLEGVSITDSYFVTAMQMMALLVSGFGLSSISRARHEETAGRTDPLLASAVSRTHWLLGQVSTTIVGTGAITLAGGLGAGVAYGLVTDDRSQIGRLVLASLATLPATLVMIGIALALFGLRPRFLGASWALYTLFVLIGIFAETLRLPIAVTAISPFEHLPDVPARSAQFVPVSTLVAVAFMLGVSGWHSFCRRDLAAS